MEKLLLSLDAKCRRKTDNIFPEGPLREKDQIKVDLVASPQKDYPLGLWIISSAEDPETSVCERDFPLEICQAGLDK